MNYSHNFGSNFPNELIPVGNKKDIDNTVKDLIVQYQSYIASGDLASANELYEQNKDKLDPYIINVKMLNRMQEDIYNTAVFALKQIKNVVSETEPADQNVDSFWYADY